MNIGIFGGSFNPIHTGHCLLASYILQFVDTIDEVWLNVSPQNPMKEANTDISDNHRLQMARLAVEGYTGIRICDVEFSMPRPSFTIATLRELKRIHPTDSFQIIIGSDNWEVFNQWKAPEEIIRNFGVIVYPRPGYILPKESGYANVSFVKAPQIEISSSFIRKSVSDGRDMRYFVPDKVADYIRLHKLYT